jgi:hypothetical protein
MHVTFVTFFFTAPLAPPLPPRCTARKVNSASPRASPAVLRAGRPGRAAVSTPYALGSSTFLIAKGQGGRSPDESWLYIGSELSTFLDVPYSWLHPAEEQEQAVARGGGGTLLSLCREVKPCRLAMVFPCCVVKCSSTHLPLGRGRNARSGT